MALKHESTGFQVMAPILSLRDHPPQASIKEGKEPVIHLHFLTPPRAWIQTGIERTPA